MKLSTERTEMNTTLLRFALGFTLLVACASSGMFFMESVFSLLLIAVWLSCMAVVVGYGSIGRVPGGATAELALNGQRRYLSKTQAVLGPAAIAALYLLHLLHGPLSVQSTWLSAVFWLFAAGVAAALQAAGRGRGAERYMKTGWLLTTGVLAFSALAAVYGWLPWPGAILRTGDREVAAAGARLGGLLQYPNTFGAVMAAALLERLTALARLPRQAFTRAGRWPGLRAGALAPVFALCLLLTESRGAFAALAAAWAVGAVLLRGRERQRYALHSAAALGAGALLAGPLVRAGLAPPALPGLAALATGLGGWAALLAALAAAAPRATRAWALGGGAAVLIAAAAALPVLPQRLTGAATLLARGEMYADALRVIGSAPWLGQGGDTWRSLYRSVQSSPYTGSEVHSGYLDLLLDLGLAGLLVLLVWLIPALRSAFRGRRRLLPSILLLLMHGLIDFDLSYGLVWLLLLWLLAWARQGSHTPVTFESPPKPVRPGVSRFTRISSLLTQGMLAVLLLGAAFLCLMQAQSLRLERLAVTAEAEQPREAAALLRRASALAPARPQMYLALAARSEPAEAAEWLRRGLSYEPDHAGLELALGTLLARSGDLTALEHLSRAVELNRYSTVTWTAALSEVAELTALKLREPGPGHQAEAAEAAAAGVGLYARYAELAGQGPWRSNDLQFGLNPAAVRLGERLRAYTEAAMLPEGTSGGL